MLERPATWIGDRMTNVPRRHHTVPRFYLEGFSLAGQVGTVELPGAKRFSQSARKASTVTDFYLLGDPAQPGASAFEESLSEVEGDAAAALRTILEGTWPLPQDQREAFGVFMLLQFLRGPNHRRQMQEMKAQLTRLDISLKGKAWMVGEFTRKLGRDLDPADIDRLWEQATRPEGPPVRVSALDHMQQIVDLVPKSIPYVLGRPWALVRFERKVLVTCDTPVVLVPSATAPEWSGVGLMNAGGIVFPLARRLGLVLTDPLPLAERGMSIIDVVAGKADLELPPSASYARLFNHSMFSSARRHVFHHPHDGDVVPYDLPEPADTEMAPIDGNFVGMGESMRAQGARPR